MAAHAPNPEPSRDEPRISGVEIRWIVAGILAILFGLFIAQNTETTKVSFVFFDAEVRLIWLFLICGVLGAVIDRLLQRRGILPTAEGKRRRRRRG